MPLPRRVALAPGARALTVTVQAPNTFANYLDAGADYYERRDQRNRGHLVRYHQNALARPGLQVTITHPGNGAPPPPDNPGQAA